jgi:hypothetical protein
VLEYLFLLAVNSDRREVRQNLRKAFKGQLEKNMNERAQLIQEKYEIEARLQSLRDQSAGNRID